MVRAATLVTWQRDTLAYYYWEQVRRQTHW